MLLSKAKLRIPFKLVGIFNYRPRFPNPANWVIVDGPAGKMGVELYDYLPPSLTTLAARASAIFALDPGTQEPSQLIFMNSCGGVDQIATLGLVESWDVIFWSGCVPSICATE